MPIKNFATKLTTSYVEDSLIAKFLTTLYTVSIFAVGVKITVFTF